jgi:hypothetical protein
VKQAVRQSLDEDDTQKQDGHQVAFVDQEVSGSSNFSHVHQTQDQQESGGAGTQEQNTETAPTITVGTEVFDFDCGFEKVNHPNQCANVEQDGFSAPNGANNESQLHQAIGERQTSTFDGVDQTQGRFDGGQEGNVHQENQDNVGKNHDVAHQDLAQRQSSATGNAFQQQLTDPGCCGLSQSGGAENREDINQATTQSASEPDAFQDSTLFGQVHQTSGGDFTGPTIFEATSPNNRCDIDHHGRNNSGGGHFSNSGQGAECVDLFLTTFCTSGGDFIVAEEEPPPCTSSEEPPPPPCDPYCVESPGILSLPTTATQGLPIEMPNYGEPADYLALIGSG